jgi:hypothetical protein
MINFRWIALTVMFSAAFLEFPDGLILDFIGLTDILMISCVSIRSIINSLILFYECKSNIPGQRILQRIRSHLTSRQNLMGFRFVDRHSDPWCWHPSVGIRRYLSVGFDRPPLLLRSFNNSVLGAKFRGRSKPTDRFR